jgi:hypothetical protein
MSLEHADDKDIEKTALLMIHGSHDDVMPLSKGRPFEFLSKTRRFYWPALCAKLGVVDKQGTNQSFEITGQHGIQIPESWFTTLRKAFTSDLYGPRSICQRLSKGGKFQYIEVANAPHNFMMNEKGIMNETYIDVRTKMVQFIHQTISVNPDSKLIERPKNPSIPSKDKKKNTGSKNVAKIWYIILGLIALLLFLSMTSRK